MRRILAREPRVGEPSALWIQRLVGEPFWDRKSTSAPSTTAALRATLASFRKRSEEVELRFRNLIVAVTLLAVGPAEFAKARSQVRPAAEPHVMIAPEEITWQPIPPNWADGPPPPGFTLGHSEVAIIEGDPAKEGAPFVIRIRSTPGTQLPPHWHRSTKTSRCFRES